MRKLLGELLYWLSSHKWQCPEKDCAFKTRAGDDYVIDMVKEAHGRYHTRKKSEENK